MGLQSPFCARCEELDLQRYIESPYAVWEGVPAEGFFIATIDSVSLRADQCSLCLQFKQFLQGFQATAQESTYGRGSSFILSCRHATRKNWSMVYFSITYLGLEREIHLFPQEALIFPSYSDGRSVPSSSTLATARESFGQPLSLNITAWSYLIQFPTWIKECRLGHNTSCGRIRNACTFPTRLIDCREGQICDDVRQPYVCLSYVWGTGAPSQNTRGSGLPAVLPRTVSDAMIVTLKIGLRYLWVDRYCINQDNLEEKHRTIRDMDIIYQAAELTIIAVAGNGPDHGLPGVTNTRVRQDRLVVGHHIFLAVENPRQEVKTSKWNTRGWTFQEALLSSRRLVFTDTQVYFQCLSSCRLEGFVRDQDSDLFWQFRAFAAIGNGSKTEQLYDRLEDYYTRELSFKTDIINAFSGVFQAFSKIQERSAGPLVTHFYGIPIVTNKYTEVPGHPDQTLHRWWSLELGGANASFALGLAWQIRSSSGNFDRVYRQNAADNPFPSWTWAAFKACRPGPTPGLLKFHFRQGPNTAPLDSAIRIRFCHRSGGMMSVTGYVFHHDDYTKFHPYFEITSIVLPGHLLRDELGSIAFSAFPRVPLHLHQEYTGMSRRAMAVYVGIVEKVWWDAEAVFILVEEIEERTYPHTTVVPEYRHVGVFSYPISLDGLDRRDIEWTRSISRLLQKTLGQGQQWTQQTLKLV